MAKKKQRETVEVKDPLRQWLRMNGWMVVSNVHHALSYPGLPDLTAGKEGRVVMIECKLPTGVLSDAQEKFKKDWESAGNEFVVIHGLEEGMKLFPR
jgi:hypothetical protein